MRKNRMKGPSREAASGSRTSRDSDRQPQVEEESFLASASYGLAANPYKASLSQEHKLHPGAGKAETRRRTFR